MPDYSKSKIYVIRSPNTESVYIGSTTRPLYERFSKHKASKKLCQAQQGKYNYVSSFDILEAGDAYIELLCDFPCERREQLNRREGQYIRATHNCVNRCVAGRSGAEYYQENKAQKMRYYQQHKKAKSAYNKRHYQQNLQKTKERVDCCCGGSYTRTHKSRHSKTIQHRKYIEFMNLSRDQIIPWLLKLK